MSRSLFVLMAFTGVASLQAAAPPISETPGAIRLGSDRLRVGYPSWPHFGGEVVVSPNGKLLASGEVGGVCLWDLPSGRVRRRFEYAEFSQGVPHAFAPDSRWLALSLGKNDNGLAWIGILDVATGTRFPLSKLDGASFLHPPSAAFTNRGRAVCSLVTRGAQQSFPAYGELYVWELPSRKELLAIPDVEKFVAAPESDVIVIRGKDGSVSVYRDGKLERFDGIRSDEKSNHELVLSPDGRLLAWVSKDRESPMGKGRRDRISIWDTATRKRLREFLGPIPRPVRVSTGANLPADSRSTPLGGLGLGSIPEFNRYIFSSNDTFCVIASDKFSVSDARTGRAITAAPIPCFDLPAFTRDGAEVAFVRPDYRVEVRRVDGKGPTTVLKGTPPYVRRVLFVYGGQGVLVLGADRKGLLSFSDVLDQSSTWRGVWDRTTGIIMHEEAGHRGAIVRVGYSHDGKTLASLDRSGELRLTRFPGGTPHPSFSSKAVGRVVDFRMMPDGEQLLAIGFDGWASFWDMASGKRLRTVDVVGKQARESLEGFTEHFWDPFGLLPLGEGLVIDPNCRVAVVPHEDGLEAVRLDTGKRIRLPLLSMGGGCIGDPPSISPGGGYVAAVQQNGSRLELEVWDLSRVKRIMKCKGETTGFTFSPDGKTFAWSEGVGEVRLFDLTNRKEAGRLSYDGGRFFARKMAFDGDSKTLAASYSDRVVYWDLTTKRRLSTGLSRDEWDPTLIPLRSGVVLSGPTFSDEDLTVRIRDLRTGMGLLPPSELPKDEGRRCFAVSPDGRTVAAGGRVVTLIDRTTGKQIARLPRYHRGLITAMAFSPDGKTLTTGGTDAAVLVWDWKRFSAPAKK